MKPFTSFKLLYCHAKCAKDIQAAFSAPQAFASHDSSVQLKNAHAGSVWLVSHHQPASEAAYNRDAYVGQQGGFVKGCADPQRGGGGVATCAPPGPASADGR
jgi:hypothetical protein